MIPKHNKFKCKNIECGIIFLRRNKDSSRTGSKNLRKSNAVTCSPECTKKYQDQRVRSQSSTKAKLEEKS